MDLRLSDLPLRRKLHHLVLHLAPVSQGGLPLDRYQALGRELAPLTWLDLNGGEPFERPDLAPLATAFRADLVTVITGVASVASVVEGTAALRAAHKGELTVALVLDGLHASHDRRHGEGSWDRVWTAFDALRSVAGLRLEIRSGLCRANADEIVALAQYVRQQRPDGHVVSLAAAGAGEAEPPTLETLRGIEGALFAELDRYVVDDGRLLTRMRRNFHHLRWNTAVRTLTEGRQVIPCLAGLSHAVVRADGAVAACDLLPPLGHLGRQSWAEVWSGPSLAAQREYIGAGGCHCTDECAMHDSIVLRPQNLPRLVTGA